ncbi:unnamed protein product (macronuclear) [Paramecium tetraurelia]|uniref:Uncharacterized protein n=1 Tax=Paramecium tetraurelia TaxID=5888 RepID=A0ECF2_PARTE|nr:uncharacterized protein GSPATT00003838001 [Paramecium tetraurelia]CAK92969.1 unnamed protein product [Paramecium tetraurelia]|eukprot:XP_001460366.1 hypothetical protein (macronuclear) [Paramecium tetraurelia strain d4-2]
MKNLNRSPLYSNDLYQNNLQSNLDMRMNFQLQKQEGKRTQELVDSIKIEKFDLLDVNDK